MTLETLINITIIAVGGISLALIILATISKDWFDWVFIVFIVIITMLLIGFSLGSIIANLLTFI